MNTENHVGKDEQDGIGKLEHMEGHQVRSLSLKTLGLAVYVPSVSELRTKSDLIRPFQGHLLGEGFRFRCTVDVGTALMRLIENFGLPNAPEYHEWSEDYMTFGREGSYWEYIFRVNEKQYLFVSHDNGRVIVGCKTAPERRTCEAFLRFIESKVNTTGHRFP